jgi:acyl carrier protein
MSAADHCSGFGGLQMEYPTLEDVTEQLQAVSGVDRIDPDVPLLDIEDLDSLDLMEWLYGFQEKYPEIGADESLFEDVDESVTLRTIYDQLAATSSPR